MNLPNTFLAAIVERMRNPFSGVIAFATGGTVTITEIVTSGSLWLTFGGALLAFLGGLWTLQTARMRYKIEFVKLKQAELEFERAHELGNGHNRRSHQPRHHRG